MTEEQFRLLERWVDAKIAAAVSDDIHEAVNLNRRQALLRNSFGLHQHSDGTGPFHYEGPET